MQKLSQCDLRLSGGQVLLPGIGLADVDVLVAGGKVVGFCTQETKMEAAEVVGLSGLTVLPGAIDAHVHLGQDITAPKEARDVSLESRAAAAGGVTSILVYLMSPEPLDNLFPKVKSLMENHSSVDFGLHFCISTAKQLKGLGRYVADFGVSSFKLFMNFRGDEGKYLGLPGTDDGFLLETLRTVASGGGMLCPHPENIELVWHERSRLQDDKRFPLGTWHFSRPPFVEAEAVQRAAYLARVAGAPLYAVHLSSAEAVDAVLLQRNRCRVYAETCPHYLTHDITSDVGLLGKVNPPLREASDREALWRAVADGTIDAVGSDHVPRHKGRKTGNIWTASAGFPGLETLLPIMLSEGHHKRGIPLTRLMDMLAANPAKLFGLYPTKGVVAIGSDADFAIVDLQKEVEIGAAGLHSAAGYSIYEGWRVRGDIVHTLVRGKFVKREGQVLHAEGHGEYLHRSRSGSAEGGSAQ